MGALVEHHAASLSIGLRHLTGNRNRVLSHRAHQHGIVKEAELNPGRFRVMYQRIIDAYNIGNRRKGKNLMAEVITSLARGVPKGLAELAQLGRTLSKRRDGILAFFDIGASNGPVEAINGRLEHLRGIALGFRNLRNYIWRSLVHSGDLQTKINAL